VRALVRSLVHDEDLAEEESYDFEIEITPAD
jgi:hypothetical protein